MESDLANAALKPSWQRWFPLNQRSKPSLFFLIAANLVPLVMALNHAWQVGEILMVFWLENVVIGFYNVFRMLFCGAKQAGYSKPFIIPFFIAHYGMFSLGHGLILYDLFFNNMGEGSMHAPFGPELILFITEKLKLWWPLFALLLSHGFSFVWHGLLGGAYRDSNPSQLMAQPYGRVVLLHVTVLLGGLLAKAVGQPLFALLLLVVLKVVVDAAVHLREHRIQ